MRWSRRKKKESKVDPETLTNYQLTRQRHKVIQELFNGVAPEDEKTRTFLKRKLDDARKKRETALKSLIRQRKEKD